MHKIIRHSRKVITAIVGGIVVLVGFILIPYPGPGWLIVFAGFAILATEFEFAAKALGWLRHKYDEWSKWLRKQPAYVQLIMLSFTGLVVVSTAYFLNTFGLINGFLKLDQDWLISPFFQ
ncbi:TIGR02611 family protein [Candidatus Saccharibacteria bacterium]|nr:TIGR02611 family protein [Candidatus Saccharibacteria bacterium]